MSSLQVSVRLNPSFDEWNGARTVVEEELQAIGKALERIRISSQLQDAFTGHLFAVHRQWCEACPPAREPGLSAGGLEKEAPTNIHTRAAAAHNPMKPKKTSVSCVSTFTQTTDMNGLQMNAQGEVDDNNDDISETSVPSSMTCLVEDEESQLDVNRTLEKPSSLKGTFVSPKFIKLEVSEGVQLPDVLLKLEENHCDVDMDSSKETPSQQIHEEELPPQHIESDGQLYLEEVNEVSDQPIKHERDSQGHCDVDMAGSSSEAMSHQGPVEEIPLDRSDVQLHWEGMNTVSDQLIKHEDSQGHCGFDMAGSSSEAMSHQGPVEEIPHDRSDVQLYLEEVNEVSDQHIGHERDSQGHCDFDMAGSNSEAMSHQGPAEEILHDRSDIPNNSAQDCEVLGPSGVSADQCPADLDSNKNVEKTSVTDDIPNNSAQGCEVLGPSGVSADQCPADLDSDKNVEKISVTGGDMKFQCSNCSKRYSCMNEYQKHLNTHTCQKPNQFANKSNVKVHMKTHTMEKSYKCDCCTSTCATKQCMKTHTGEKAHECSLCGKRFPQPSHVKIHMRTHGGEKPYSCNICDYSCSQKGNLTKHMRVHTGQKAHECSLCGKSYTQSSYLKIHMRTHSGEKPYSCDVCDYRCSHKGRLTIHMRVHTGEKRHECSLCGKRFTRSTDLKIHMRTHSGEKPYSCGICDNRFSTKGLLTRHMGVHTGQKPHECSLCDKRFLRPSHLKIHMRTHSGEKPYSCGICDFRCSHKSTLTNHMRVHTRERPHECSL